MQIEFRRREYSQAFSVRGVANARGFGQTEWSILIPEFHAAQADPAIPLVLPQREASTSDGWECALFELALYTMQQLLGWTDPGAGLAWWYRKGCPELDDPRIALLTALRKDEPHFELFVAWCWRHGGFYGGPGSFLDLIRHLADSASPDPMHERPLERFPDDGLRNRVFARIAEMERAGGYVTNPLTGGYNSLHLGHSMASCSPDETRGYVVHSSPDDRRAVLVLDEAMGWYRQLLLHGRTLPTLKDRSWHVDVVVRPVGWLGTFRQSRKTGLWFQGRHAIHEAGQIDSVPSP